jgi:hypothetical protein
VSGVQPSITLVEESLPPLAEARRTKRALRPSPDKFYKGGSQEKTHLLRPEFFLLPSPLDRARSVLTFRARDSVAGPCDPVDGFSLPAVFISCLRRSQSVLKPAKQNGGQVPTMVLSETRGLWLFRVIREGLGSSVRLSARGRTAPNFTAETRSRTRVSGETDGHRQRKSPGWSGFGQRHSSCLWLQMLGVEAHILLPHDQHDRGNLSGQGQTRHLRPEALGQ